MILSVQSYSVFQIVFLSQEIEYFGKQFISKECPRRNICASLVAPTLWDVDFEGEELWIKSKVCALPKYGIRSMFLHGYFILCF